MRARVLKQDGSITVTFGPGTQRQPGFTGVVSQIHWDNPELVDALRIAFGCQDNERIAALEVTEQGIRAQFERA